MPERPAPERPAPERPPGTAPRPAGLADGFPADTAEPGTPDEHQIAALQYGHALSTLKTQLHHHGAQVQHGYLHASPQGGWVDALVLCGTHLQRWQLFTRFDTVHVLTRHDPLTRLPDDYRPVLRQSGQARTYNHLLRHDAGTLTVRDNHPGFVALRPLLQDGSVDWQGRGEHDAPRSGRYAPWAAALLLTALLALITLLR